MAIFLSKDQLYRLLQRELPEGVYPDGAPSGFYSTSSIYSKADVAATGYANLERIYQNYFPQTADEKIDDWVVKAFGTKFSDSVTLDQKRSRVIEKIRKQPKITLWEILKLVSGYLPEGVYVQIFEYGTRQLSPWKLGVSLLGLNTYLYFVSAKDQLGISSDQWCSYISSLHWYLGKDKLGVNTYLFGGDQSLIQKAQSDAYGYEIRIFNYALSGLDLESMKKDVKASEPARTSFILNQNQLLTDYNLTVPVTDVDEFSLVNCITRDSTSSTGYSGMKEA